MTLAHNSHNQLASSSNTKDRAEQETLHTNTMRIFKNWSQSLIPVLLNTPQSCLIEETIPNLEGLIRNAPHQLSDIRIVLTTRTAYETDLVEAITRVLRSKRYTEKLIESTMSIAQEVLMNAIIHGNLGLDLKLKMNLDRPDQAMYFANTFQKINERLQEDAYGLKPITVELTCHYDSVILDVSDQGEGFDFESFKQKYKDSKLQKGMDLIFLLAKDIDYNRKTKTISILIEDTAQVVSKAESVNLSDLTIGICTGDEQKYNTLKTQLETSYSINTYKTDIETLDVFNITSDCDFLICLNDIEPDKFAEILDDIRDFSSHIDLPVLYQRQETFRFEDHEALTQLVNDFIGAEAPLSEIIARIKAHSTMSKAQSEFYEFYDNYKREIAQAQSTIEILENSAPIVLENHITKQPLIGLINGTQTDIDSLDRNIFNENIAPVPYSQGFTFNLQEHDYFLFMSLVGGLSPILLLSHIKGLVEHIKGKNEMLLPSDILDITSTSMRNILPDKANLNLICSMWEPEQGRFIYAYNGAFIPIIYDTDLQKYTIYKTEISLPSSTQNKIFNFIDGTSFLIFDANIPINPNRLSDFEQDLLQNALTKDEVIDYLRENPLKDQHGASLPFFMAHPIKRS